MTESYSPQPQQRGLRMGDLLRQLPDPRPPAVKAQRLAAVQKLTQSMDDGREVPYVNLSLEEIRRHELRDVVLWEYNPGQILGHGSWGAWANWAQEKLWDLARQSRSQQPARDHSPEELATGKPSADHGRPADDVERLEGEIAELKASHDFRLAYTDYLIAGIDEDQRQREQQRREIEDIRRHVAGLPEPDRTDPVAEEATAFLAEMLRAEELGIAVWDESERAWEVHPDHRPRFEPPTVVVSRRQFTVQDLHRRFRKVRQVGPDRWVACCPAHDDRNPSLSIRRGHSNWLFRCMSRGCRFEDIVRAADLYGFDLTIRSAL